MIKKIIVCSIIAFVIVSCSVARYRHNDDYIVVYKIERTGDVGAALPGYIILQWPTKSYDWYSPGIFSGEIGCYEIRGDTLSLFPRYEYYESPYPIKKLDSLTVLPTKFLIKGEELIIIRDSLSDPYWKPRIKLW